MDKSEYISTFMEGAALLDDYSKLVQKLLGEIFTLRQDVKAKDVEIDEIKERHKCDVAEMDDIARDCGWHVRCRGCDKDFEPDCELSEIVGSGRYCGGSEWCCP